MGLLSRIFSRSAEGPEAFFSGYAAERGLEYHGTDHLKETTPLLGAGLDRWADHVMTGFLPGGVPGILALYTYEDHIDDGQGEARAIRHPYTVVVHNLPDVSGFADEIRLVQREGAHFRDEARARKKGMRRLELESIAADRRYEIYFSDADDEVWLKRLFVPTFIDWLAHRSPDGFEFELWESGFCAYVPGHLETAEQLDELCKAASISGDRLAWEAAEGLPGGAVGRRLDRG